MDPKLRMKIVLEALAGDASEVAQRHGVQVEELERWTADFLRAATPRRSRLVPALAFTACLGASAALSQAAAFPLSLITFSANTPAVASQVNSNFATLKNGVEYVKTQTESKVGALGSNGVQARSLNVSGNANVIGYTLLSGGAAITSGATITGDTTVNGNTTLNGTTTIAGNLNVTGELSSRWVVEAPYDSTKAAGATASSTVELDNNKLRLLCGDGDGCTLRLVMKNTNGGGQDKSMPPVYFDYDGNNFMASETGLPTPTFASGGSGAFSDGNGKVEFALRAWNCYLTDAQYTPGTDNKSDSTQSMYLLNYNSDTGWKATCMLVIDD